MIKQSNEAELIDIKTKEKEELVDPVEEKRYVVAKLAKTKDGYKIIDKKEDQYFDDAVQKLVTTSMVDDVDGENEIYTILEKQGDTFIDAFKEDRKIVKVNINEKNEKISTEVFNDFVKYFGQPLDDTNENDFKLMLDKIDKAFYTAVNDDEDGIDIYIIENKGNFIKISLKTTYSDFAPQIKIPAKDVELYLSSDDDYLDIYSDIIEEREF